MPTEKELDTIKQMLDQVENNIRGVKSLLFSHEIAEKAASFKTAEEGDAIEGIFDGEKMIGQGNKHFDVPANYASKSKLVAGDLMKLTIGEDGTFLYKQIGPIERKKMVGILKEVAPKKFVVICGEKEYQVLAASITYFKANDGDKLTIMVPKDTPCEWAAVENLVS